MFFDNSQQGTDPVTGCRSVVQFLCLGKIKGQLFNYYSPLLGKKRTLQKMIDQYGNDTSLWPCFKIGPCCMSRVQHLQQCQMCSSTKHDLAPTSTQQQQHNLICFFFLLFEISPWNKKSDTDPKILQPTIFILSPDTETHKILVLLQCHSNPEIAAAL